MNDLSYWKTELILFLDTEHLFNAVGFNGILYQQIFKDFYGLAIEVRRKGKRLIKLKYLEETEREIDDFFHVAELIIEKKQSLNPSKPAMIDIIRGCNVKSDVIAKKAAFFNELRRMGIYRGDLLFKKINNQFNIEDQNTVASIAKDLNQKGISFTEEKCFSILKTFSKINTLREGKNSRFFEDIGCILVSGRSLTNFIAFHPLIKGNKDIPFATDIDFVTNRLWFKLKKGLANQQSTPNSLNILAKAQAVLSGQINKSISEKFNKLEDDFLNGKLPKTEAEFLSNSLRERSSVPEQLVPEKVSSAIAFLNYDGYEHHLREKTLLLQKVDEGEKAKRQLQQMRDKEFAEKEKIIKTKSLIRTSLIGLAIIASIMFIYYVLCCLIFRCASEKDSELAIYSTIIAVAIGTLPFMKIRGGINWLKKINKKYIEHENSKFT